MAAPMNIGRPQNLVSTWLWMRMWRMYFVSAGGLMGGMTSVSATEMGAALGATTILRGLE